MKRLSAEELRAAKLQHHYTLLWEQAIPLVKFAVGRIAREGFSHSIDDMVQDGNLAAGRAVRTWDPSKGEFATWIIARVEGAVRDHLRRQASGMVGGRDAPGRTGLFEEETAAGEHSVSDEVETQQDEETLLQALQLMKDPERELIENRFGLAGRKPLSTEEIAVAYSAPQRTTERALSQAVKKLAGLLKKSRYFFEPRRKRTDDDKRTGERPLR